MGIDETDVFSPFFHAWMPLELVKDIVKYSLVEFNSNAGGKA
jgi:hypothetical protein